jgi:DEAD/DEAH box helicase
MHDTRQAPDLFAALKPKVARWFRRKFEEPTDVQVQSVQHVLAARSVLISSPTGSGKTLAAFLGIFNHLKGAGLVRHPERRHSRSRRARHGDGKALRMEKRWRCPYYALSVSVSGPSTSLGMTSETAFDNPARDVRILPRP